MYSNITWFALGGMVTKSVFVVVEDMMVVSGGDDCFGEFGKR